ncbi:MAG: hypothetical protein ABIH46_12165 [Chloroflexota bacterium]
MIEELDIPGLLEHFKSGGFTRGERILLSNSGTNVTLLAVIFNRPIEVRLKDQHEKDGTLFRHVELVKVERDNETCSVVATARSKIPVGKNNPEVIQDIVAGRMGLGHILVKHQLTTRRLLLEANRSPQMFWRTYQIVGSGVDLTITEWFQREVFEDAGFV